MELYHIINRGVDKRKIFSDNRDYARFVHDLYEFNSSERASPNLSREFRMMDIRCPSFDTQLGERLVTIHFFCLMPNHYHLLLSPAIENGISLFMKKINMGYAKYFNERNQRSGALFQGKYRSVHIVSDAHFLYLPLYIHLNPLDLFEPSWRHQTISNHKKTFSFLNSYRWSSHRDYLGEKNFPSVTKRDFFLKQYGDTKGYTQMFEKYLKQFDISVFEDTMIEPK